MRQISFVSTAACLKAFILPCQEAGGLLTLERQQFRKTLAMAPLEDLAPEIIFTTNDIASIQTAEIVAARLDLAGPVIITPLLEENDQGLHFERLLFLHARLQSLLFVLPQERLQRLASDLLGQPEVPDIGPGEVMAFEIGNRRRQLPSRLLWQTREGVLMRETAVEPMRPSPLTMPAPVVA